MTEISHSLISLRCRTPFWRETDEQEPQRKALPDERRCPSHHELFPEEPGIRSINEFSIRDGRVQPTCCKKCNSTKHTQYARRRRQEAAQSVERLQAIVDQKRAELAAAEEQLQYVMDLEHEAACRFGHAQREHCQHDAHSKPHPRA